MEEIAKMLPTSIINIIGMGVVVFVMIIAGTVAQKWGEQFYKWMRGNKEKRSEKPNDYSGIERRHDRLNLESSIAGWMESMAALNKTLVENNEEFREFISIWKKSHFELKEDVEEVKRKQERNWVRLFDQEIPSLQKFK